MRYPAYPEYKDSGVEWLGEIPEGWEVRRLKFLASEPLRYGANEPAELDDRELPRYIRITDVNEDGSLNEDTFRSIPHEIAKEYLLNNGDILLARSGATVGKSFQYFNNWGIAAFAGYLIRFRVDTSIYNPRYAYYFFRNKGYWGWIDSILILATIQNVSAEKYASAILPLPNIDEQKSIARFLDKKTSQIDALIEKKKELIEKLKEQRMALITKAVTKGLDDTVPMKDSGVEWLGEIPAGWDVRRLKFLASCNDESLPENTDYNKIIQYVDISSVSLVEGIKKIEELTFEKAPSRARRIVRNGDTIISTVRTYLKSIATIKEPSDGLIVSTGFAVIRPNEIINSDYISYFLQNQYFIDSVVARSTGVSYPAINAPELTCITIVFPLSIDEQKAIAEYLDEKTAKIDALIEKVERVIEKLKEYRITLITDAVTGKIRVG